MRNSGNRDILLPTERDPWRVLRDLWSSIRWARHRPIPAAAPASQPEDLDLAFEYLAAQCQAAACLLTDLAEALAARMTLLMGQARFNVQTRLANALAQPSSARFFTALYLATRIPVPQARRPLLRMLTQPDLAHWSFPPHPAPAGDPAASDPSRTTATFDLRPAVVAALGQLRDPSLLSLFHGLLDKLRNKPANHPVVIAVQWSLMNLAPGGQGEPLPPSILYPTPTSPPSRPTTPTPPRPNQPYPSHPNQATPSRSNPPHQSRPNSSERDDLLTGF